MFTIFPEKWDTPIFTRTLRDMPQSRRDGTAVYTDSGEISSAPNFLKSRDNPVFLRGAAADSSGGNKTEYVNGIPMLPQYVWLHGNWIAQELAKQAREKKEKPH